MNRSMEAVEYIAGVDEVGRGPLAGPVFAAAVILDPAYPIKGLQDSKALCAKKREDYSNIITNHALAWAIGRAEVVEIDRINILQASLLAMQRAVAALPLSPTFILVDGNQLPTGLPCPAKAIIKGDRHVPVISAASIVAKVARDQEMVTLAKLFPEYGFEKHKGYPTKQHIAALTQYGVTSIHRKSYAPVRKLLTA